LIITVFPTEVFSEGTKGKRNKTRRVHLSFAGFSQRDHNRTK
jgi:hypothetical protein